MLPSEIVSKACESSCRSVSKIYRRISDMLGVQWAPASLPLSRRLQTLAATGWICLILFGEASCIYLFFQLLYSRFWWAAVIYTIWIIKDIDTPCTGSRIGQWCRNWSWWHYFRDYFPLKLVKTCDLDPSKNYLFACYPHGVVCTGAFGAFATNALGFEQLFPGMTSHLITLGGHFFVPFFRELVLFLGGCSCDKEGIRYLLDKKNNRGKCVALIVGGAAEALDAHPGDYKIILSRRKGFVRLAMEKGAPIVPVFSFGEVDVFRPAANPPTSWLRRLQEAVRAATGVSPVWPVGRGVLQYSYGVVPLRTPVTTVVGAPMEVERNLDPTDEEVDAVHAEFTRRLKQLFESEKSKYLKNHQETQLVIT